MNRPLRAASSLAALTVWTIGPVLAQEVDSIAVAAPAAVASPAAAAAPSPDAYLASFGDAVNARPARAADYLGQAMGEYPAWAGPLLREALAKAPASPETTYDLVFAAVQKSPTSAAELVEVARAARPQHGEVIDRASRDAMGQPEGGEDDLIADSGKGGGGGKDFSKDILQTVDSSKGKTPPTPPVALLLPDPVSPFRDFYQPTVFRPYVFGPPPGEDPITE